MLPQPHGWGSIFLMTRSPLYAAAFLAKPATPPGEGASSAPRLVDVFFGRCGRTQLLGGHPSGDVIRRTQFITVRLRLGPQGDDVLWQSVVLADYGGPGVGSREEERSVGTVRRIMLDLIP